MEVSGLEFQRDDAAFDAGMLRAIGHALALAPEDVFEQARVRNVFAERRFGGDALSLAEWIDFALVTAEGAVVEPEAGLAVAAH